MNIEQGLFKFDFVDYHAILGVSLDADVKQIRKRYYKVARRLHPDALLAATDTEKQQASEFLSKMVNPAYEKLTQEKEMAEYQVVLRLKGAALSRQSESLNLQTEAAKALLAANNALNLYTNSLNQLASQQYESLEHMLDVTGKISELNLAYLVNSAGSAATASTPSTSSGRAPAPAANSATSAKPKPPPPPSPKQQRASIIDSYLNRAKQSELKRDFPQAILEMREAVKAHPNSAPCHAQLASIYFQASQVTMARIHLKRALEIDPKNQVARTLEPKVNKATQSKSGKGNSKGSTKGADASSHGGGLFGLFRGKQK